MKRKERRLGYSWILSGLLLAATGVGCSSAAGDTNVRKIDGALCTSASLSSDNPNYYALPGGTVNWTATSGCTGTAEYQFWFKSPSGPWFIAQDWSNTATYPWATTGLEVGTWNMQVWVRDISSGSYQSWAGRTFDLSGSSAACTANSATLSQASGVQGTSVTFTDSASTCSPTEYEIWHLAPGAGAWTLDSGYSTANSSYVWNTTGAAIGGHQFQIWARAQGSTQAYQSYTSAFYSVLASTPCTGVTAAFSPANQAAVGTTVTITPTASGCTSPEYRYFYQPPGGAWQELQAYSSSPSSAWNTNLDPSGTYNFQVWVRAQGSTAAYEAYTGPTYVLTPNTPTTAFSIGGGFAHNCELTSTGKVGCWGYDAHGEVGNGTVAQSVNSPVAVSGISTGISLSAGYSHTCVALSNGTVQCWGSNAHGQLGNNSTTDSAVPVAVSGLTNVGAVGSGNSHSCAVLADGTVRCWGYNSQGQLGNGNKAESHVPVTVTGLGSVSKIAAGYYHTCALSLAGTVSCWGLGTSGELGNGLATSSLAPVAVSGLTGVTSITASGSNSCALKSDGTIWCWGQNTQYGTLGSGSVASQPAPVQVAGITTATSVAIGPYHGCAALQSGSAMCWGYNFQGELGNGTVTDSPTPVAVSNLTNVASVGVALYTTCATLSNNTASCWGYGVLGSLGNGMNGSQPTPVAVGAVP